MADEFLKNCNPKMAEAWRRDSKQKPSTQFNSTTSADRTGIQSAITGQPRKSTSSPGAGEKLLKNDIAAPRPRSKK